MSHRNEIGSQRAIHKNIDPANPHIYVTIDPQTFLEHTLKILAIKVYFKKMPVQYSRSNLLS